MNKCILFIANFDTMKAINIYDHRLGQVFLGHFFSFPSTFVQLSNIFVLPFFIREKKRINL